MSVDGTSNRFMSKSGFTMSYIDPNGPPNYDSPVRGIFEQNLWGKDDLR